MIFFMIGIYLYCGLLIGIDLIKDFSNYNVHNKYEDGFHGLNRTAISVGLMFLPSVLLVVIVYSTYEFIKRR